MSSNLTQPKNASDAVTARKNSTTKAQKKIPSAIMTNKAPEPADSKAAVGSQTARKTKKPIPAGQNTATAASTKKCFIKRSNSNVSSNDSKSGKANDVASVIERLKT